MANVRTPYQLNPEVLAQEQPGRIRTYLDELRRLQPNELQAIIINMEALLSSSVLTLADTYKAPGNMDLFIFQVQGYIRFPALNAEPTTFLGFLNLTPTERFLVKAQNCAVNLQNRDRKHRYIDSGQTGAGTTVATLMPPAGYPIVYPPEAPLMLPKNEILEATFALQDSTAAVVGGATRYGLTLTGVLVPRET